MAKKKTTKEATPPIEAQQQGTAHPPMHLNVPSADPTDPDAAELVVYGPAIESPRIPDQPMRTVAQPQTQEPAHAELSSAGSCPFSAQRYA